MSRGSGAAPNASGLLAERYPVDGNGWRVVHEQSRQSLGFNVRLRRQAEDAMRDLYATGVDFTRPAGELKKDPAFTQAARVIETWKQRARACCHDGEHYSPYTYALNGRCSGDGKPRRS